MITDKIDNIYFFYPSKIVGGAEYLFSRLALNLQEKYKKTVYYIDYKDGFIRKQEKFKSLNFIDFEDGYKTEIFSAGIVITPISNIYRISDYLNIKNDKIKLFLWSIHPYNLVHITPEAEVLQYFSAKQNKYILKYIADNTYNVLKKMLKDFDKENAIYFMDYDNYIFNETIWGNIIHENYLKIVGEEKFVFAPEFIINENEINVAVMGRFSEEKVTSVINVAENLNALKTDKKKRLHIIGDGEYRNQFIPEKYTSLEIIFKGTLLSEKLNNYFIENVDILFSMGTCCLEGAALKLPVVAIPYSYKNYNLNKFYYLGDTEKNDIGARLSLYKNFANRKFEDIITQIYDENKKGYIGNKCYKYFIKNYSLDSISKLLLEKLSTDSLSFEKYFSIKKGAGELKRNKNIFYKILRGYIRAKNK